jgi:hypothetical protein
MISLALVVLLAPKGATAMHQTPHLKVEKKVELRKEMKVEPKVIELTKKDEKKPLPKLEAAKPEPKICLRYPVTITHGFDSSTFALATCGGQPAPGAIEQLSILARPEIVEKPKGPVADLMKVQGDFVSPGIKRVDPRLPVALQAVLDHFDKGGSVREVHLISGYRPLSKGSFHATAQALDIRIDGVSNEQIVGFCKTLSDVGCGYYPNSTFVHIDIRPQGTGHVAWIDASGPGESPQYVSTWPPPVDPFADDPKADFASLPPLPQL